MTAVITQWNLILKISFTILVAQSCILHTEYCISPLELRNTFSLCGIALIDTLLFIWQ